MSEKPNENIQDVVGDTTKKPETKAGYGLEISPSPELKSFAESIGDVQNAIDHNNPVKFSRMQQMQKAIEALTINIGGKEVPIGKLEASDAFKKNTEIWEKIRQKGINNLRTDELKSLTAITSEIAEILSHYKGSLMFSNLAFLSNKAAEHFSRHQGDLWLNGLASLSDKAAEHLSHQQGSLYLRGLASLSDQAIESLSHHNGGLDLGGLASLSDQAAESLSRHKKDFLDLSGLSFISDQAAEHLSLHQGSLVLDGITSLPDQVAEHLSHHQGSIVLRGITYLSDEAAKLLAKHTKLIIASKAIKQQINKFEEAESVK